MRPIRVRSQNSYTREQSIAHNFRQRCTCSAEERPYTHTVSSGAVAQLARAPRLQRGGQGFESLQLHHERKLTR